MPCDWELTSLCEIERCVVRAAAGCCHNERSSGNAADIAAKLAEKGFGAMPGEKSQLEEEF
jgi:hypothetical protein